MTKYLVGIILALSFVSCFSLLSPSRQLQKASNNMQEYKKVYPTLFTEKIDTVYETVRDTIVNLGISYDTTFYSSLDTLKIGNDTIQTTIYIDRLAETTKYRVRTEVRHDTVYSEEKIKIKYINKETQTNAIVEQKPNYFKMIMMILFILLLILLIINTLRQQNRRF